MGGLTGVHPIDWAVVAGIFVAIAGVVVRVIIPGWLHIRSLQENGTTVKVAGPASNGNGSLAAHEAEWRGRFGAQMDQQDKRLDALLVATTATERVVVEIERRTQGSEAAIRALTEMAPKVDTILGLTKKRMARKKL